MRAIKFRAWIPSRSKMIQVMQLIIPNGNNEQGFQEISISDRYSITQPSFWLDHVLMQYTGLHDKNGKEIYEGDIVRTDSGNIGKVCHSESVCWHLFYFMKDNPNIDKTKPYDHSSKIKQLWSMCGKYNRCEIIGNIYENSELISEVK